MDENKKEDRYERKVQWQPMVELIIVLMTILGATIPLYIHTDSKMQEHRKETNEILIGIREDMKQFQAEIKDFHGRLCAIEERNKERK